jgi:hypothetical protein
MNYPMTDSVAASILHYDRCFFHFLLFSSLGWQRVHLHSIPETPFPTKLLSNHIIGSKAQMYQLLVIELITTIICHLIYIAVSPF